MIIPDFAWTYERNLTMRMRECHHRVLHEKLPRVYKAQKD